MTPTNKYQARFVSFLMAQRDLYIDRLRTVMTALVVVFHAAITYGGSGGWFYHEVKSSTSLPSTLLTLFCGTNQAYFMGFFFLLAGYFTPASLERKGYTRFIGDPYWFHDRYVVRTYDRWGNVVYVEVDPYSGAFIGEVRF